VQVQICTLVKSADELPVRSRQLFACGFTARLLYRSDAAEALYMIFPQDTLILGVQESGAE
jgi:hypothetical protein